jgi:putative aminopeptidase
MKMQSRLVLVLVGLVCVGAAEPTMSQYYSGREETPAVSGYEQQLAGEIRNAIKDFSPKTDNLGNVYVTLGSGSPRRLIVAPIDQPG